jgi:hypothetical protein
MMTCMERVACTLDLSPMRKRRRRWLTLADGAFVERVETTEGLRLVFRQGDGVEAELRELAHLESECCAFARWTVDTGDGLAMLDVTGASAEAVAALHAMFRSLV